jgi:hypothetical protein
MSSVTTGGNVFVSGENFKVIMASICHKNHKQPYAADNLLDWKEAKQTLGGESSCICLITSTAHAS